MVKIFNICTTGVLFSLSLLVGCSDSSTSSSGGSSGTTTTSTTSVVSATGIADFDSLSLSTEKISVEGLNDNINNAENILTAYVADRHNHSVPDGTVVNFLSDSGALLDQSCATENGFCSVTWRSQKPKPMDGKATVMVYVLGEESFLDLNDNDNFDVGEATFDVSEPYVDSNHNGAYDAATEEFVDNNTDNVFSAGDGLYTGVNCVGDVTVCNRTTQLIWTETEFFVAESIADIVLPQPINVATDASTDLAFTITDGSTNVDVDTGFGIPMPDGTTVAIKAASGTLVGTSFTITSGLIAVSSTYTAPAAAVTDTITVTVTTPDTETATIKTFSINVI